MSRHKPATAKISLGRQRLPFNHRTPAPLRAKPRTPPHLAGPAGRNQYINMSLCLPPAICPPFPGGPPCPPKAGSAREAEIERECVFFGGGGGTSRNHSVLEIGPGYGRRGARARDRIRHRLSTGFGAEGRPIHGNRDPRSVALTRAALPLHRLRANRKAPTQRPHRPDAATIRLQRHFQSLAFLSTATVSTRVLMPVSCPALKYHKTLTVVDTPGTPPSVCPQANRCTR